MKLSTNKSLLLALLIILSCGQGPILSGFDSNQWQVDKDGCNGERLVLADEIVKRKDELAGLNQNEIKSIFGKPNRHELYSRNKKAFVYFVDGGPECLEKKANYDKLIIRFDGIGRSKEIILYKN